MGCKNAQLAGAAAVWGEAEGKQLVQSGEEAASRDLRAALQCCRKVIAEVEPVHSGVWWEDGEAAHTSWHGSFQLNMSSNLGWSNCGTGCPEILCWLNPWVFKTRQEKSPKQCWVWPHSWACFGQRLDRRQCEMPSSLNCHMDPTKERERKEKNMLEDVSVESRLTSGASGLPDSSENKWKLSSSLEAVRRYQSDGKER